MIRFARLPKNVVQSDDEELEVPSELTLFSFLPLGVANEGRVTVAVKTDDDEEPNVAPLYATETTGSVPADALQNTRPYIPVRQISAAGGVVVHETGDGVEILMIRRRGEWDLPKGKQDVGESIQRCALREVAEEVGASALEILCKLGTTSHGYRRNDVFRAKRTHWYLMETTDVTFSPQISEDIVEVAWMDLEEALDRVGYPSLKTALKRWMPIISDGSQHRSSPHLNNTD